MVFESLWSFGRDIFRQGIVTLLGVQVYLSIYFVCGGFTEGFRAYRLPGTFLGVASVARQPPNVGSDATINTNPGIL